jgi:hypothetical protein
MFSADDIQARLRQKPFRPLRIIASEGQQFDIHHPDLVLVGRRDLTIGFPDPNNPAIYDRVTRVAMVHVVSIEDLPTPPAPPGNGQG